MYTQPKAFGPYKLCHQRSCWSTPSCSRQGKCCPHNKVLELLLVSVTRLDPVSGNLNIYIILSELLLFFCLSYNIKMSHFLNEQLKNIKCVWPFCSSTFISSVEVWGSTALIQDSCPCPLYVNILYYFIYTLPCPVVVLLTAHFPSKSICSCNHQCWRVRSERHACSSSPK